MIRPPQIFISYAHRDHKFVEQLEREITSWGMRPWVDHQGLAGGQEWSAELELAIKTSAALVLVLTPAALRSQVIVREYRTALAHQIPVVMLGLRRVAALPDELRAIHAIDCVSRQWRGVELLAVALADRGIGAPEPAMLGSAWPVPLMLAPHESMKSAERLDTPTGWAYVPDISISALTLVVSLSIATEAAYKIPGLSQVWPWSALSRLADLQSSPMLWFVPPTLVFGCMLLVFVAVLRLLFFTGFIVGWFSPERVVLTPSGVTVRLFRLRWARPAIQISHMPFRAVERIEHGRAWLGAIRLNFIARGSGAVYDIVLPRRLGPVAAIASAIIAGPQTYQSASEDPSLPSAMAGQTGSVTASPTALAPAPTPVRSRMYAVIADRHEMRHLGDIQARLAARGLTMANLAPSPVDASWLVAPTDAMRDAAFVLYLVSPRTSRSPEAQLILTDLLAAGRPVIPLLMRPISAMPEALARLQWVDFTARVDHQRSICLLLGAIEQLGIPVARQGVALDWELALARAMHNREPQDWRVFRPHSMARPIYRQYQRLALQPLFITLIACLLLALLTPMLAPSVAVDARMLIPLGPAASLAIFSLAFFLVVLLIITGFRRLTIGRSRGVAASNSFFRKVQRGYFVPEMLVVTPDGLIIHTMNSLRAAFDDYTLPFAEVREITFHATYHVKAQMRCAMRTGKIIKVNLPGILANVEVAPEAILQAWRASQRHPGPAGTLP
ncbi:MAG TPA: toll/interleukin-1 receptor domain-containing protein [Ktedonobacterales bacterium]